MHNVLVHSVLTPVRRIRIDFSATVFEARVCGVVCKAKERLEDRAHLGGLHAARMCVGGITACQQQRKRSHNCTKALLQRVQSTNSRRSYQGVVDTGACDFVGRLEPKSVALRSSCHLHACASQQVTQRTFQRRQHAHNHSPNCPLESHVALYIVVGVGDPECRRQRVPARSGWLERCAGTFALPPTDSRLKQTRRLSVHLSK